MEKISIVISIIALIISFFSPLFEYWWSKKLNKINIEAEYFDKVYTDFLMIQLPEARLKISYIEESIGGIDDYIDTLRNMRKKSIYFKFANETFYQSLLKKIQELENLIVLSSGKKCEANEYANFTLEFDKLERSIYNCICNGHLGKKERKKIRIKIIRE